MREWVEGCDVGPDNPRASVEDPRSGHIVIPLCDVLRTGAGQPDTPRQFAVNADWLRVESDFPIILLLDDVRVAPIRPQVWSAENTPTNLWQNAVPWNRPAETPWPAGMQFEVNRAVKYVSMSVPPQVVESSILAKDFPGNVHVYYGSGGIRNVGPGAWLHASQEIILDPPVPGVLQNFLPWRFYTHNLVSVAPGGPRTGTPQQLQKIIPAEVEILSISFVAEGSNPFLFRMQLYHVDQLGFETDWYGSNVRLLDASVGSYIVDLLAPIRVPVWAVDTRGLNTVSAWAVRAQLAGGHQFQSMSCEIAWRYR